MKKFLTIILLFCSGALAFYLLAWRLPLTQPAALAPLPQTGRTLLLPLDSRPVCTTLPQELGALAGFKIILPPNAALDNYNQPGERQKLYDWLETELPRSEAAVISADNLISGSLLASRLAQDRTAEQERFLRQLEKWQQSLPQLPLSVYTIIPRLLVGSAVPDRWYSYKLLRYSQSRDAADTFGDFAAARSAVQYQEEIPPAILQKYLTLYRGNDRFNREFLLAAPGGSCLKLIGQDDSAPLGLPNENMRRVQYALSGADAEQNIAVTYGADEIASLCLARSFLAGAGLTGGQALKIKIVYADGSIPYLYMPYMPVSVSASLAEKMRLLGLRETADAADADIILYVSCGSDNYRPQRAQAEKLHQLLKSGKNIALIDLSANFSTEELLLPLLLKDNVPLNRLRAYAGWNTFSNSAGTALAQAAIITGQQKRLPPERLPQLYAQNLQLLCTRLLDDYAYQKLLHSRLKARLETMAVEPTQLNEREKAYCDNLIRQFIRRQAAELLHYNLGRTPFYEDAGGAYYLRGLTVEADLPWARIFEVRLNVKTETGVKNKS